MKCMAIKFVFFTVNIVKLEYKLNVTKIHEPAWNTIIFDILNFKVRKRIRQDLLI